MTAKILLRQSFSRATNYVYKDGQSEVIDCRGVLSTDPLSAAASFNAQAKLRPEIKNPVGHICISFHPNDEPKLTNEVMAELCSEWMKRMGIPDTQYLLVRHYDTKHPHMHLLFNRIDDNEKLISDKMWYIRNQNICKDIKYEYGLTFSPGKRNVNIKRLRSEDRVRYQMYYDVKAALDHAEHWFDFGSRLKEKGIDIEVKRSQETQRAYGIVFSRNGYSIKGSKLDRGLSYNKIDKVLMDKFAKKERIEQARRLVEWKESQSQSQAKEVAASLFEGNLGTSQEQDMKETPKKKKRGGIKR